MLEDVRDRGTPIPTPAARASTPAGRSRSVSAHPIQPVHASTARASAAAVSRVQPHPRAQHHSQPSAETLTHAIRRMRRQGYTAQQVSVEVRRWHPEWSPTKVKSEVAASKNPVAYTAKNNALPRITSRGPAPTHASANCTPLIQRRATHEHGLIHDVGGALGWLVHTARRHESLLAHTLLPAPLGDLARNRKLSALARWADRKAVEQAAAAAAIPTYLLGYYAPYEVRHHVWNGPGLRTIERLGIHGDMYLDRVEHAHGDPRGAFDEETRRIRLGPLHFTWPWPLPGAHYRQGRPVIDY